MNNGTARDTSSTFFYQPGIVLLDMDVATETTNAILSWTNLTNTSDLNGSFPATEPSGTYYSGAQHLQSFGERYKDIHGYLAVVVCCFGIIANVLNIVVLTRRNMISATNCILTGLAVSDGLTMLAYLPFALRFYCLYGTSPTPERNSLGAIRFLLFYACFSVVVHSVSIWLTVTLAVFRYIFIRYPRHGAVLCSLRRAKIAVFLVYVVTLVVCTPNFVTITVKGHSSTVNNVTKYLWIVGFKQDTKADEFVANFNFWVQALLVKLLPCVGLTILSFLIIQTMQNAEKRRRNLRNQNSREEENGRDRKTNRTTRMLLAVVFLFLLTEFPQGILTLLSGPLPHFHQEIYQPLGDTMDILALINNGINFILYCTMSKQFRDTFIELFLQRPSLNNNRGFSPVTTTTTTTTASKVDYV